jgi:hypothetical protein
MKLSNICQSGAGFAVILPRLDFPRNLEPRARVSTPVERLLQRFRLAGIA